MTITDAGIVTFAQRPRKNWRDRERQLDPAVAEPPRLSSMGLRHEHVMRIEMGFEAGGIRWRNIQTGLREGAELKLQGGAQVTNRNQQVFEVIHDQCRAVRMRGEQTRDIDLPVRV